jgi:hypothetical protein
MHDAATPGSREAALVNGQIEGFYNFIAFVAALAMVPFTRRSGAKVMHAFCLHPAGARRRVHADLQHVHRHPDDDPDLHSAALPLFYQAWLGGNPDRAIIGFAGSFTVLQCMTSELEPANCPACGRNGLGTGALGVGGGVAVSIASTSTFSGYAATRSISERVASGMPRSVAPGSALPAVT